MHFHHQVARSVVSTTIALGGQPSAPSRRDVASALARVLELLARAVVAT